MWSGFSTRPFSNCKRYNLFWCVHITHLFNVNELMGLVLAQTMMCVNTVKICQENAQFIFQTRAHDTHTLTHHSMHVALHFMRRQTTTNEDELRHCGPAYRTNIDATAKCKMVIFFTNACARHRALNPQHKKTVHRIVNKNAMSRREREKNGANFCTSKLIKYVSSSV